MTMNQIAARSNVLDRKAYSTLLEYFADRAVIQRGTAGPSIFGPQRVDILKMGAPPPNGLQALVQEILQREDLYLVHIEVRNYPNDRKEFLEHQKELDWLLDEVSLA